MKGNTMEEIVENPPTNYDAINTALAESNHPVLQQYKDKIAELETKAQRSLEIDQERINTINRLRIEKTNFQDRVKNVLIEALENYDEETVKYIADNLDVELTVSKTYEVNVTFRIDVETEVGKEIDPDWDFDFSVSSNSSDFDITDYSSDTVWSNEQD
jgi:hypothetical protein